MRVGFARKSGPGPIECGHAGETRRPESDRQAEFAGRLTTPLVLLPDHEGAEFRLGEGVRGLGNGSGLSTPAGPSLTEVERQRRRAGPIVRTCLADTNEWA